MKYHNNEYTIVTEPPPVCDSHYVKAVKKGKEYKVPYPFDCNRFADELNKKSNEKERLTPAQRLFFWTEYKKPIE